MKSLSTNNKFINIKEKEEKKNINFLKQNLAINKNQDLNDKKNNTRNMYYKIKQSNTTINTKNTKNTINTISYINSLNGSNANMSFSRQNSTKFIDYNKFVVNKSISTNNVKSNDVKNKKQNNSSPKNRRLIDVDSFIKEIINGNNNNNNGNNNNTGNNPMNNIKNVSSDLCFIPRSASSDDFIIKKINKKKSKNIYSETNDNKIILLLNQLKYLEESNQRKSALETIKDLKLKCKELYQTKNKIELEIKEIYEKYNITTKNASLTKIKAYNKKIINDSTSNSKSKSSLIGNSSNNNDGTDYNKLISNTVKSSLINNSNGASKNNTPKFVERKKEILGTLNLNSNSKTSLSNIIINHESYEKLSNNEEMSDTFTNTFNCEFNKQLPCELNSNVLCNVSENIHKSNELRINIENNLNSKLSDAYNIYDNINKQMDYINKRANDIINKENMLLKKMFIYYKILEYNKKISNNDTNSIVACNLKGDLSRSKLSTTISLLSSNRHLFSTTDKNKENYKYNLDSCNKDEDPNNIIPLNLLIERNNDTEYEAMPKNIIQREHSYSQLSTTNKNINNQSNSQNGNMYKNIVIDCLDSVSVINQEYENKEDSEDDEWKEYDIDYNEGTSLFIKGTKIRVISKKAIKYNKDFNTNSSLDKYLNEYYKNSLNDRNSQNKNIENIENNEINDKYKVFSSIIGGNSEKTSILKKSGINTSNSRDSYFLNQSNYYYNKKIKGFIKQKEIKKDNTNNANEINNEIEVDNAPHNFTLGVLNKSNNYQNSPNNINKINDLNNNEISTISLIKNASSLDNTNKNRLNKNNFYTQHNKDIMIYSNSSLSLNNNNSSSLLNNNNNISDTKRNRIPYNNSNSAKTYKLNNKTLVNSSSKQLQPRTTFLIPNKSLLTKESQNINNNENKISFFSHIKESSLNNLNTKSNEFSSLQNKLIKSVSLKKSSNNTANITKNNILTNNTNNTNNTNITNITFKSNQRLTPRRRQSKYIKDNYLNSSLNSNDVILNLVSEMKTNESKYTKNQINNSNKKNFNNHLKRISEINETPIYNKISNERYSIKLIKKSITNQPQLFFKSRNNEKMIIKKIDLKCVSLNRSTVVYEKNNNERICFKRKSLKISTNCYNNSVVFEKQAYELYNGLRVKVNVNSINRNNLLRINYLKKEDILCANKNDIIDADSRSNHNLYKNTNVNNNTNNYFVSVNGNNYTEALSYNEKLITDKIVINYVSKNSVSSNNQNNQYLLHNNKLQTKSNNTETSNINLSEMQSCASNNKNISNKDGRNNNNYDNDIAEISQTVIYEKLEPEVHYIIKQRNNKLENSIPYKKRDRDSFLNKLSTNEGDNSKLERTEERRKKSILSSNSNANTSINNKNNLGKRIFSKESQESENKEKSISESSSKLSESVEEVEAVKVKSINQILLNAFNKNKNANGNKIQ